MNKVIAITGPTGSGKSTVSLALAKKMDKCVVIEIDHVKHMIISGFHRQKGQNGGIVWEYTEWELVGETVGILSKNFLKHGYRVVIGGYMHTEGWQALEDVQKVDHKFMLSPSKETIKIRDTERDEKYFMGSEAIREHIGYLSGNGFEDFAVIDSTDQTADETVDDILALIQE